MPSTNQPPQTRASLILRLRDPADLCAWQEFVEIYRPVINAFARQHGLQVADADDVSQEVLTRVARSIDGWDPDPQKGSFRAWLATVTRNLVIQFFRESSRQPATGVDSQIGGLLDSSTDRSVQARQFNLECERQLFLWAARDRRDEIWRKWSRFQIPHHVRTVLSM